MPIRFIACIDGNLSFQTNKYVKMDLIELEILFLPEDKGKR